MKPRKPSIGCWKVTMLAASTAFCALLMTACGNANKSNQPSEAAIDTTQASIEKDKESVNKAVAEGLEIVSKEETNVVAPILPEFPGGRKALVRYLQKNLKYPDEALMRGQEGRVVVGFVVEKDGRISKCRVVQTTDSIFNAEALRVVATMPRWKPGMLKDGRKVSVFHRLPLTFIPRPTEKEGSPTAKS